MKSLALLLVLSAAPAAVAVTPFTLPWMNAEAPGTTYKMTDHPNGIFVVEAYFLGCIYCNQNAPNVDDLAAKYQNEPRVQVLDVGVDRHESDYVTWINKHHPNHPVLNDGGMKLIRELGTQGYPSTYVIDCKGNVAYQTEGSWEGSMAADIQSAVDELLKQDCQASR